MSETGPNETVPQQAQGTDCLQAIQPASDGMPATDNAAVPHTATTAHPTAPVDPPGQQQQRPQQHGCTATSPSCIAEPDAGACTRPMGSVEKLASVTVDGVFPTGMDDTAQAQVHEGQNTQVTYASGTLQAAAAGVEVGAGDLQPQQHQQHEQLGNQHGHQPPAPHQQQQERQVPAGTAPGLAVLDAAALPTGSAGPVPPRQHAQAGGTSAAGGDGSRAPSGLLAGDAAGAFRLPLKRPAPLDAAVEQGERVGDPAGDAGGQADEDLDTPSMAGRAPLLAPDATLALARLGSLATPASDAAADGGEGADVAGRDDGGDGDVPYDAASLPAVLPPPVEVTMPLRVHDGRPGTVKPRGANAYYVKGAVCGVFDPALYMQQKDCIRCNGTLMSRSKFEQTGGSNMAKWYRSIRVLPEMETLGEWLESRGLPIFKGRPRRCPVRPNPPQEVTPGGAASGSRPATAAAGGGAPLRASSGEGSGGSGSVCDVRGRSQAAGAGAGTVAGSPAPAGGGEEVYRALKRQHTGQLSQLQLSQLAALAQLHGLQVRPPLPPQATGGASAPGPALRAWAKPPQQPAPEGGGEVGGGPEERSGGIGGGGAHRLSRHLSLPPQAVHSGALSAPLRPAGGELFGLESGGPGPAPFRETQPLLQPPEEERKRLLLEALAAQYGGTGAGGLDRSARGPAVGGMGEGGLGLLDEPTRAGARAPQPPPHQQQPGSLADALASVLAARRQTQLEEQQRQQASHYAEEAEADAAGAGMLEFRQHGRRTGRLPDTDAAPGASRVLDPSGIGSLAVRQAARPDIAQGAAATAAVDAARRGPWLDPTPPNPAVGGLSAPPPPLLHQLQPAAAPGVFEPAGRGVIRRPTRQGGAPGLPDIPWGVLGGSDDDGRGLPRGGSGTAAAAGTPGGGGGGGRGRDMDPSADLGYGFGLGPLDFAGGGGGGRGGPVDEEHEDAGIDYEAVQQEVGRFGAPALLGSIQGEMEQLLRRLRVLQNLRQAVLAADPRGGDGDGAIGGAGGGAVRGSGLLATDALGQQAMQQQSGRGGGPAGARLAYGPPGHGGPLPAAAGGAREPYVRDAGYGRGGPARGGLRPDLKPDAALLGAFGVGGPAEDGGAGANAPQQQQHPDAARLLLELWARAQGANTPVAAPDLAALLGAAGVGGGRGADDDGAALGGSGRPGGGPARGRDARQWHMDEDEQPLPPRGRRGWY